MLASFLSASPAPNLDCGKLNEGHVPLPDSKNLRRDRNISSLGALCRLTPSVAAPRDLGNMALDNVRLLGGCFE
jgi:hypothetical protein